MELSISSVCWFFCDSTGGSLAFGGEGTGPPLPRAAMVDCWEDFSDLPYSEKGDNASAHAHKINVHPHFHTKT